MLCFIVGQPTPLGRRSGFHSPLMKTSRLGTKLGLLVPGPIYQTRNQTLRFQHWLNRTCQKRQLPIGCIIV
jgi:hypothetical protein